MTLTQKAKKAAAAGLALSTVLWSVSFLALPTAFAAAHSNGCLVNASGTIYLIDGGQRRGFPSADVLLSHGNNFGQVVTANADDLALPSGPVMVYAEGSIVKGPNDPLVYLVSNGQKRGFVSGSVFTGLGYSFANIQWAPANTFADLPTGSNVESSTERHPGGTWVIDGTGTVWRMTATGRVGLPSMEVFNSYGKSWSTIVKANAADLAATNEGVAPLRPACTGGSSSNDGSLQGGAGNLDRAEFISSISGEEVGEGDNDVKVLGLDLEADDGSDLRLTSIKVEFMENGAGGSQKLEDYATDVSLWLGSTKIAEADADDFNEDADLYTKTFTPSTNAIIRMDQVGKLYVAVSAHDNIDSGDLGDANNDWQVAVSSVRYVDAQGAVVTETGLDDIGTIDDGDLSSFTFESFTTANDVELEVALNTDEDDVNEAHIIDIDDNDNTEDIEILAFTLEATGDSDINVSEIPVVITTDGPTDLTDDNESVVVLEARLMMGSTELASENVLAGGAVTFEDLDIDVDADEVVELTVVVDVASTEDFSEGTTIMAEIDADSVDDIEAEDAEGNDLGDDELVGTATGEASAMYENGIEVQYVSSSAVKTFTADDADEEDQGTFKITFKVTANGEDMFIDKPCAENEDQADAGEGVSFLITNDDNNSTTCLLSSSSSDNEDTGDAFMVNEGTTRTFTLTVIATADATESDFAEVSLEAINWGLASNGDNESYYTFNLNDYKTDSLSLAGI